MNPAHIIQNRRIEATAPEITFPTNFDVINGRGQGVQRHPGNAKYRTLVHLNKSLYAKCPRPDKSKISKGIVAAVRHVGGRFLEFDEALGVYHDIGDKKAYEKTSQALREGQCKTRKQIDEEKNPNSRVALLLQNQQRELSSEGYFGYELQLMLSLHRAENLSAANRQILPSQQAANRQIFPSQQAANPQIFPSRSLYGAAGSSANPQVTANPTAEDANPTDETHSPYITPSPTSNRHIFNRHIFPSLAANHQILPTDQAHTGRGASLGSSDDTANSISDPQKVSLQSSHESWKSWMQRSSLFNTSLNASFSNVCNDALVRPSIGPFETKAGQEVIAPGHTSESTSGRRPPASNIQRPSLQYYKKEDRDSSRTLQTSNLSCQTDTAKQPPARS